MKLGLGQIVPLAVLIVVLLSPAASAMIIEGHSPIVLLVVDPNGHEIGCLGSDPTHCTSTLSPDFKDTMPAYEEAFYTFPGDPTCATSDCPFVTILSPTPGTWTVYFYSTLTGSNTGTTYITEEQCSSNYYQWSNPYSGGTWSSTTTRTSSTYSTSTSSCTTINIIGSPGDPVQIGAGSSGSTTFFFSPAGSTGVPEFPYGMLLLIAIALPALLIVNRFQRVHRAKHQQA